VVEWRAMMSKGLQRILRLAVLAGGGLALVAAGAGPGARAQPAAGVWRFAVSGDSRNCGDVVMPAIAAGVLADGARFYWHLGDFRKIYDFDEDFQHLPAWRSRPPTIRDYLDQAWADFIEHQLRPFGTLPVYLGVGNHDVIPPMTREALLVWFADWFNAPAVRAQRLADDPRDFRPHTYFHWIEGGVDFLNLDNASAEQFDAEQMRWIERRLEQAARDPAIRAVVVGLHKPLPDSLSGGHGMEESPAGLATGRELGRRLIALQQAGKHVYVVAAHDHFYVAGAMNTDYWRAQGGPLEAWIIGTAGAVRYRLPADASRAREARTNVYGYLLATVQPDGQIAFVFRPIEESAVPAATRATFGPAFVHWCFAENTVAR
jgi:hypothetical protein